MYYILVNNLKQEKLQKETLRFMTLNQIRTYRYSVLERTKKKRFHCVNLSQSNSMEIFEEVKS